ncbi:hypothetical protein RJ641_031440 [Dillenia turbinata]|uniref:Uncharacterized protein n=1 Tax=Dillenia turbinata TaxID=194707 RepID=A0AAN8W2L0_9MAGN
MKSLSVRLPSSPPLQKHPKTPHKPSINLPKCVHRSTSSSKTSNSPNSMSRAPPYPTPNTFSFTSKLLSNSSPTSIDNFFNRNPFFVSGVAFIWLIDIPLTRNYFKKYKFTKAIDAFRKLCDDPGAEFLHIGDDKSLAVLGSPNLKILNKGVTQVEYLEGSFDGNSMKAAELLFKSGFKEAFAIRGGARGKDGWQVFLFILH